MLYGVVRSELNESYSLVAFGILCPITMREYVSEMKIAPNAFTGSGVERKVKRLGGNEILCRYYFHIFNGV